MSNTIRDITGICFELPNVEFEVGAGWHSGTVSIDGRTIFTGSCLECYGFVSGLKFNAKAVQVHELLEKICRGNIEILRGEFGVTVKNVRTMTNELEDVYLSDDEVNERAIKEKQG